MSNADIVYYNLTIGNNDFKTAGQLTYTDVPANITALNNIPIIQNPDDYYASIIRFQIPALTLPLLSVIIQTPVTDINKTIYSFSITDQSNNNGNATQTFVEWIPQVITQLPPTPTPIQTLSEYYLCYSYRWFIDLWNTAIKTACSLYTATIITQIPFFAYDSATQLISLYTSSQFDANQPNHLKLWINNSFLNYFVGMDKVNVNYSPNNNLYGLDNYLVVRNNLVNDVSLNSLSYIKMDYEFTAYGYWNFFKNIIVTTSMNVNSEVVFNNVNTTTQNVNYVNILEDYYPDLALQSGAGISSQIFTYNAPSLYRIFTFNQKTPLYKIDLGVNVVDIYGNIYPLLIPTGQLANFKIMFIKKSVYVGNKNMLL